MNEELQRRVEELFQAALELPAAQRLEYVRDASRGDDKLRAEVSSLLAAHGSAQSFLESPAGENLFGVSPLTPPGVNDDGLNLRPGDMVGPYKLRELLGEGGLGMVYLADQEAPIRRRVAVKIIKLGMDTRQVVARFEAERQALALMDHANVARVFDAGTTDRGRPYFVMEYVPGVPITDYCDRHRLGTEQRLRIFIDVCEAIQHAHQKGLIHRDIKPSNVLVAVGDTASSASSTDGGQRPSRDTTSGEGRASGVRVKVIDFGIAKAVSQRLSEQTIFTEQGQLIGTPEYASPEQVEMSGLNIDTRTDIYSLGVLLYELLTGTLPFDSRRLREGGVAQIQRIIREDEPPKLSTRVSTLGGDLPQVAKNRGCDAPTLSRQLRGDLDWITLKAMDKDRTRRYASASELALEIRRYLANEPVLAGPPSVSYRMKKFVRRNRALVAGAAAVFAVLIVAVFSTGAALRRESRQRMVAERALLEAKTVSEFLTEMIGAPDPYAAQEHDGVARDIKVLDVLDDAGAKIERMLADQPEVEATVRTAVGTTYRNLGAFDKAEQHLTKALSMRRVLFGNSDSTTLEAMNNMALLRRDQGRLEAAESLLRESLNTCRNTFGFEAQSTLETMSVLAGVLYLRDEIAEAESLSRAVIDAGERVLGQGHELLELPMSVLAFLLEERNEPREAERWQRRVLASVRRRLGDENPQTADAMGNLALSLKNQGRFEEADPLYTESLAVYQRELGETHPKTLSAVNNLGVFLRNRGKAEAAERMLRQTLDACRRELGATNAQTILVMGNLARTLEDMNEFAGAEQLYVQALDFSTGTEQAGMRLTLLNNYGFFLRRQGRAKEAIPLFAEVVNVRENALGAKHQQSVLALRHMGLCLMDADQFADAQETFERALALRIEVSGPDDQETAVETNNVASVLEKQANFTAAEPLRRRCVEIMESLRPEFWLTDVFRINLALCLARAAKVNEACAMLQRAYPALRAKLGPDNAQVQATRRRIERICTDMGKDQVQCLCQILDESVGDG